ncbi:MAG: hypothetical protein ABSF98_15915 [Bryobacteraceae bacterium]
MPFGTCPSCGGHNLRASKMRGFVERLQSLAGVFPFRCRQCGTRFRTLLWDLRSWKYARCPNCLGTELGRWPEHNYNAPLGLRLLVGLGATRYRCELCRQNFASFRACKERFSWRKRREAARAAASAREPASGPSE